MSASSGISVFFLRLFGLGVGSSSASGIDWSRYQLRGGLLTPTEADFYGPLLSAALSADLMPFPKVRLEDIISVASQRNASERTRRILYGLRNRIKSRHLDFVLCRTQDVLRPAVAVELDDPSHQSAKARKADGFKDELCEAVGLPLVRIKVASSYDSMSLAAAIATAAARCGL